jgi:hypothetical protein
VLLAQLEKLDYSGECKHHLHLSKSIADGLENWAMTCGRSLTIGVAIVVVVGNAHPTLRFF